jgi:hypothetical protein
MESIGPFYTKRFLLKNVKLNKPVFLVVGSIIGIDTDMARSIGQNRITNAFASAPEVYFNGNKISEIEIFYMDKSKGEKRLLNEGHNPIKMMLDENSYQEVNKFIAKKEASRYIITMKLEWEKNNVSKMTLEAGTERLVYNFKHDDKINPYKNFFDLYTFYSEEWNEK